MNSTQRKYLCDKITEKVKDKIKTYNVNKHGGKRNNSGAKQKYEEPTKTVTFRVPVSKIKEVKKIVSDYLKSLIEGINPYL